ncbi:SunT ABC-type bacteriocin/lantibiotic exporters, contain an N-terminal double-glycine peptidase domain [Candidatus Nanopelagicaceae bacterium]
MKIRNLSEQLNRILGLYSEKDRGKLRLVAAAQVTLSLLDLFGVAMIGALGALTVMGIQSRPPGPRVSAFLEFIYLDGYSFRTQAALLATVAVIAMVLKSLLSVYLNKRILTFIALRTARISGNLAKRLMDQPLNEIKSQSTQQRLFELTSGVSAIGVGIVGPTLQTLGDLSLMLILVGGLFFVDGLMTILAFVIFGSIASLGYYITRKNIGQSALLNTKFSISSSEMIVSLISMYREYYLRDSLKNVIKDFEGERIELAKHSSKLNFYPSVPKYFLETSIFVTVLFLGAFQFSRLDASNAISTLAIFLAAASRIAPASLRIQQSIVGIRNNIDMALPAIELNELLHEAKKSTAVLPTAQVSPDIKFDRPFDISVNVRKFRFESDSKFELREILFNVPEGSSLAIVGPSGSGKSTLVDLMLGFLSPQDSFISVGGQTVGSLVKQFPGLFGYVPQEIPILNGSIVENIALANSINMDDIFDVIAMSDLQSCVESLPNGISTEIGDRGMNLSGGQRQRIGLARAFYAKPKILFMDEATSALDSMTEANIAESLKLLHGKVSTIIVAHRLSTVRSADQIVYLEGGRALAIGSFDAVRAQVPNFDKQAKLMGL